VIGEMGRACRTHGKVRSVKIVCKSESKILLAWPRCRRIIILKGIIKT